MRLKAFSHARNCQQMDRAYVFKNAAWAYFILDTSQIL